MNVAVVGAREGEGEGEGYTNCELASESPILVVNFHSFASDLLFTHSHTHSNWTILNGCVLHSVLCNAGDDWGTAEECVSAAGLDPGPRAGDAAAAVAAVRAALSPAGAAGHRRCGSARAVWEKERSVRVRQCLSKSTTNLICSFVSIDSALISSY